MNSIGVGTPSHDKVSRQTSPMPTKHYNNIIKNMGNNKYVVIGPQLNQQPGHPFLRAAGIIGLGAGLGALGYRYRQPLKKLGQKVINYTTDKFHHLFNPINETNTTNTTNATNQTNNRVSF